MTAKALAPNHDKIFGIGLSRTGTSSLAMALSLLGYRVHHYPSLDPETLKAISSGNGDLKCLEPFDAALDNPIPAIFKSLATIYPTSRFILTQRDINTWLNSCRQFFTLKDREPSPPNLRAKAKLYRKMIFGTDTFKQPEFQRAYTRHQKAVTTFFQSSRERILVLDITAGDGWNKLCRFLGAPNPQTPFPHRNSIKQRIRQSLRVTGTNSHSPTQDTPLRANYDDSIDSPHVSNRTQRMT